MNPETEKRVVVDVDGVIAQKQDREYEDVDPDEEVVETLRQYHDDGFYIILHTARNMKTFEGRIGKINAETAPTLLEWLEEHNIPYDEIHYGKPWCGESGFYIDDKAVRPSEFVSMTHSNIQEMLEEDR